MKKRFIVVVLLAVLAVGLLSFAQTRAASALVACNPLVHFPCTGGGIVCIDKHGHRHRFHDHMNTSQFHCIAI